MTRRWMVAESAGGVRGVLVLGLSVLLLHVGAGVAGGQMVPLDPHPEAGAWVVGASFLSIDHEVLRDHNLLGARVGYELNPVMDLGGILALPTEDTRRIEQGLLAVSFGHDLLPPSHDERGAYSLGYELGVLGYDPGPGVLAGHGHLTGSLRAWGNADRNVTLGYRAGGWWVGREGLGPTGDLDYQWSVGLHLRPVTVVFDFQPEGNAAFSDSPFLAVTLAWSPGA